MNRICEHCSMDIEIRNPSGFCDHLYYPELCSFCDTRPDPLDVSIKQTENLQCVLQDLLDELAFYSDFIESVPKLSRAVMKAYQEIEKQKETK